MRIGLNVLFLVPGVVGGTETYARSLIRSLTEVDARNDYVLFVNQLAARTDWGAAPNLRQVVCPIEGSRRAMRYAWEQLALPVQLRREGIEVVHSMGYVGPLAAPCPAVLTVYDANFVALGGYMSRRRRLTLRLFVEASARRARQVITTSEFSRRELVAFLPALAGKLSTVPGAAREAVRPAEACIAAAQARYGLDGPYTIAFGSASPHKNIARLVEAFGSIAPDVPQRLLLLGRLPAVAAGRLGDRAIALGYVPDDDVAPLLAGADALAFPSWYEGFGLPVVDAQALGVPVVCSRAAALPEVAGDGAVFFDPHSTADMARALRTVLLDRRLRAELAARAQANAARFTWRRAAEATLEVYRRALAA